MPVHRMIGADQHVHHRRLRGGSTAADQQPVEFRKWGRRNPGSLISDSDRISAVGSLLSPCCPPHLLTAHLPQVDLDDTWFRTPKDRIPIFVDPYPRSTSC